VGVQDTPGNSAKAIVARKEKKLRELGHFIEADSVEYIDKDKGEIYILKKAGKTLRLSILSNTYDGGWLDVEVAREGDEKNRKC